MKTIEIEVTPEGEVTIEAQGFKGQSCVEVTKAFEDALGAVGKRMKKPEYYQTAQAVGKAQVGR